LSAADISAQLFSTSAGEFHSYGTTGNMVLPASETHGRAIYMNSTSSYSGTTTTLSTYSTASMHVANGSIQTIASTLDGTTLADDTGFIPTAPQRVAPPTEAPLGLGWDALILLLLIAAIYALYLRKKRHIHQPAASES